MGFRREGRPHAFLLVLVLLPLVASLGSDLVDVDSAQIGEVVREMAQNNDYVFLRDNGRKYLDKSILSLWKIVVFFEILGPTNIAYRFPVLIMTILSLWSIYRMVLLVSGRERRAWLAALAYGASPGLFAMYLDPKIDIYLNAYVIFAHHAYFAGRYRNPRFFLLMYVFMGLGFMTKGPIALFIPAVSIGGDLLLRRDWHLLRRMNPLLGVPIALFFPLIWGYLLYRDYGPYGPYFFFYLQSFGRVFGSGYKFAVKYDPLYFVTTFLWTFLTFAMAIVIYVAGGIVTLQRKSGGVLRSVRGLFSDIVTNRFKDGDFVAHFWTFGVLGLLVFVRYQIPNYIYWVLPGAALVVARPLELLYDRAAARAGPPRPWIRYLHFLVPGCYFLFVLAVPFIVVDVPWFYILVPLVFALPFLLRAHIPLVVSTSLVGASAAFLVISAFVWPVFLKYRPAREIARLVGEQEPHRKELYTFLAPARSYAFYSRRLTKPIFDRSRFVKVLKRDGARLLVTRLTTLPLLQALLAPKESHVKLEIVSQFPIYRVVRPKATFLNKHRRKDLTDTMLLVRASLLRRQEERRR